jgi:hypothetical protein
MSRARVVGRLAAIGVVIGLWACGGDDTGTTPTPAPSPFSGNYTLGFQPGPSCRLPAATYTVDVTATQLQNGSHTELHVTLPGNDATLSIEGLFLDSATVRGSMSTQTDVPVSGGNYLYLRTIATGTVTRAADGRSEVVGGTAQGDMTVTTAAFVPTDCFALDHIWSLRTR